VYRQPRQAQTSYFIYIVLLYPIRLPKSTSACAAHFRPPARAPFTPKRKTSPPRRTTVVRAKYFSLLRVPTTSIRPNHQTWPHHESWCAPNLTTHHGCTGEIFFAPTCANDIHSPNQQTSPRPKSWRPPNSLPHHGCTGEKYFAPTCVIHAPSPNHQPSPRPISWHPPNVTTRRMCGGEIFFARPCVINPPSPNHQTSPHPKSWRPPQCNHEPHV